MGCHALLQGIFPTQRSNHVSSCFAGGFFTTEPPGKSTVSLEGLFCSVLFFTVYRIIGRAGKKGIIFNHTAESGHREQVPLLLPGNHLLNWEDWKLPSLFSVPGKIHCHDSRSNSLEWGRCSSLKRGSKAEKENKGCWQVMTKMSMTPHRAIVQINWWWVQSSRKRAPPMWRRLKPPVGCFLSFVDRATGKAQKSRGWEASPGLRERQAWLVCNLWPRMSHKTSPSSVLKELNDDMCLAPCLRL